MGRADTVIGEPATRLRSGAPATDEYGNPIPGADVETVIPGWAFDPGGSREPLEVGRAQTVTTPKLYRTEPADILSTDRMRVRGLTYQVQGHPAAWVSPFTGALFGIVVELLLVEG